MVGYIRAVPIRQRDALAFVLAHHRHHRPPNGSVLQVAAELSGTIVGVIVVGLPIARRLDDGWTAEVTRCCTTGVPNVCSFLYARGWDAVRALGYRRLVTYTLPAEGGASLRASGWVECGPAGGRPWSHAGRPRRDDHPLGRKVRWEKCTADYPETASARPPSAPCAVLPDNDLFNGEPR